MVSKLVVSSGKLSYNENITAQDSFETQKFATLTRSKILLRGTAVKFFISTIPCKRGFKFEVVRRMSESLAVKRALLDA